MWDVGHYHFIANVRNANNTNLSFHIFYTKLFFMELTFDKFRESFTDEQLIYELTKFIHCGGSASQFAEAWKIDFSKLMETVRSDKNFTEAYNNSKQNRKEYFIEKLNEEILNVASFNIADAFDDVGNLKPISEMPENLQKAISGVDVTKDTQNETQSVKIKIHDRLKAIDMLAKKEGLYTQKVELKADDSLLSLLSSKEK